MPLIRRDTHNITPLNPDFVGSGRGVGSGVTVGTGVAGIVAVNTAEILTVCFVETSTLQI